MTTSTATVLTSPHDLLAAVPFLIGYHPRNSLVVISLKGAAIGMAMRVDFPLGSDEILACSQQLVSHLVREGAQAAIVVGYLPEQSGEQFTSFNAHGLEPSLIDPVMKLIVEVGIELAEAIEVRGDRFTSLLCHDRECCPPEGSLMLQAGDARVSAEQVALGHPMPFAGIEQMRDSIAALPRDKELAKALRTIEEIDYDSLSPQEVHRLQREGALALNSLCESYGVDGVRVDRGLLALVLVRLHDLQVRDYAMGLATPEDALSLWAMWRWLLRIAPKGYVAPVAVIFATASYERGEGALAQRALDRAIADDAGYQMAKLLRRTFAAGWPPESFSAMRAELHPKICALLFSHDD